ncbi:MULTISPECIES: pyridoxal phosphate-dependent aminotransferase [unclassified Halomonas]|uniref:pyridoxal phosphate-dependent aminotransferase n=1 Tax=unclassified Halomonas TaxID=2609666 RepID=UPI0007D98E8F|nr:MULTISPECIES: pyridoxal phosphate-dependent aminotransferase [unclassified Halomonas]MBT2787783.1 pyridoxal phosphate-dependent aminotransferase [Halomonas sp. ISL-106]MBT2799606.1 pyridoxal phosphate-dependent aminotransferase [Halomonas sp. ISL-104]OAL61432.1 hypothetical protein A6R74_14570 [Halomonas sp. ALS9]
MDVFSDLREALSRSSDSYSVHQGKLYVNPKLREVISDIDEILIEPEIHSDKGGQLSLRKKISEAFLGKEIRFNEISICNGGTNGLSLVLQSSICSERRNVHVISPYWLYLPCVVSSAKGVIKEHSSLDQSGNLISEKEILESIRISLSDKSGLVYVANPANPVGNCFSLSFLSELNEVCRFYKIPLVVDHAYYSFSIEHHLCKEIPKIPYELQDDNIYNVFTFSKLMGIPGARIGFVQSSEYRAEKIEEQYRGTNYAPNSFSQSIVYHYLRNNELINARRKLFYENLMITRECLNEICVLPEGGFFAFIKIPKDIDKSVLLEHGIGMVSGELFGSGYNDFARLCFTSESPDRLASCYRNLIGLMT